ncbi:MAG: aldo/keto reductase, partial [Steroidobacteraceae bacterium]
LIPMARAVGLGVMPWSPLASGLLSGKYASAAGANPDPAGGRGAMLAAYGRVNERTVAVADAVKRTADRLGATSAQVALAWTLSNPVVAAPIVGARTLRQLGDNLGSLEVELAEEHRAELDSASRIELGFPHDFRKLDFIRAALTGGTKLQPRE